MFRDYSDPDVRRRGGLNGIDRTVERCPYADECSGCFTDGYTDFVECPTFDLNGGDPRDIEPTKGVYRPL